jgi:hypothetical protein
MVNAPTANTPGALLPAGYYGVDWPLLPAAATTTAPGCVGD